MLNKTNEVKNADKLSAKQKTAFAVCTAAMIVLIYGVPALAAMDNLSPAVIVSIACIVIMAVSVFKGGLNKIAPDEEVIK